MIESGRSTIFGEEIHHSSAYRILGLFNGLLIGLALALGAWGLAAFTQSGLPTRMPVSGFVLAGVLVILVTAATGWLTARFAKGWLTVILWLFAAVLVVLIISYETSYIRTFLIWLADRRFWGLPVYSLPVGTILAALIAGIFIFLLLVVLAFLQDYRLESIYGRLSENKRLSLAALVSLSLPLPIIALAGFITNSMLGGTGTTLAIQLVHQVIETGRTYEGDLFQLSREDGVNYNAIRGVRELMSANYTLGLGGFDATGSAILVTADFDNGAWIECRVVNEQVGFCSDAALPYTTGFATLITGQPLPEVCAGCRIRISDSWRTWLAARSDNFDSNPQIERVVQQGAYTLMRAESPNGDYAIACWFNRSNVIELDSCTEVTAN